MFQHLFLIHLNNLQTLEDQKKKTELLVFLDVLYPICKTSNPCEDILLLSLNAMLSDFAIILPSTNNFSGLFVASFFIFSSLSISIISPFLTISALIFFLLGLSYGRSNALSLHALELQAAV